MSNEKSLIYNTYFISLYVIYVFSPYFFFSQCDPNTTRERLVIQFPPVTEGVHHCTVSPNSRRPGNVKLNSTKDPVLYASTKADFPLGHRLQDGVTDWVRAGPGVRRPRGAHPARLSVYPWVCGSTPPSPWAPPNTFTA